MDEPQQNPGVPGSSGPGGPPGGTPPPNQGGPPPPNPSPSAPPLGRQGPPPPPKNPFGGASEPASESESKPTPPPPESMGVRTMQSDVKSMERGDEKPIPESVMAPDTKKESVFTPETQGGLEMDEDEGGGGKKKMMFWIIGIVVVVALGAVGYFVVYPMLFPSGPTTPPAPPVTAPPPSTMTPHTSFFITAPSGKSNISLEATNVSFLKISEALRPVSTTPGADGTLQELEIKDPVTGQVAWPAYLQAFGAGLSGSDLSTWFEDDFTAFVYSGGGKVWPGYVARLKPGVTAEAIKTGLAPLESSDLTKFYLFPPGDAQGTFDDGAVNGVDSRYIVFSQDGAAFSYTVLDPFVLFSTSYEGAQQAATLLGF